MREIIDIIKGVQLELGGLAVDGIAGPKTWAAIAWKLGANGGQDGRLPSQAESLTSGIVDLRSERNIETLLPHVQPVAREFVARVNLLFEGFQNGTVAKIISGTRSYAEQDALYAKGRTAAGEIVTQARAGYSNHNFGIAFDIGLFDDRGNYLADSPLYDHAGRIGKSLGLSWGGDWRSFQDKPHFELRPGWASELAEKDMIAELRRRTTKGEAIA